MTRWTIAILIFGMFAIVGNADAAEMRGVKVNIRASDAADAKVNEEVQLYSKSYALVIGIDNYTGDWPRLGKAIEDARNVSKALEDAGFEVTLKTDLNSDELEDAFGEFFIEKGNDPDARLLVWFAGHGHTDQKGEGYLIPADGALERDRKKFLRTAISLRDFGKFVRYAESKHVFTIFDSCFSGTIFNVARSAPPPQITRITTKPVRQFLTSGDAGQEVSDDGTFAKLFIEAIKGERRADGNGDGYLTASEIGSFLDVSMSNYTQNRQTPRFGKLRSPEFDKGDFVFQLSSVSASAVLPRQELRQPAAPKRVEIQAIDREMVASERVNVRRDPSVKSAKVSRLKAGAVIEVTGKVKSGGNLWYRVALKSGGEGYVFGSLLGTPTTPMPKPAAPVSPTGNANNENLFWKSVQSSNDPALFTAYLEQFPNGTFAPLAKAKIKGLRKKLAARTNPPIRKAPIRSSAGVIAPWFSGKWCWESNGGGIVNITRTSAKKNQYTAHNPSGNRDTIGAAYMQDGYLVTEIMWQSQRLRRKYRIKDNRKIIEIERWMDGRTAKSGGAIYWKC